MFVLFSPAAVGALHRFISAVVFLDNLTVLGLGRNLYVTHVSAFFQFYILNTTKSCKMQQIICFSDDGVLNNIMFRYLYTWKYKECNSL